MSNDLQWSRLYRPTFDEMVVGNPEVIGEMREASKKALAMLIVGAFGQGKTSAGRNMAIEINGSDAGLIEEPSTDRGIGYIRALQERVKYSPPKKKWVVIIDEAHALSKDAFSALLKLLEDPPHKKVLFILCTNQQHKIPKEIISRCRTVELEPPSMEDGVSYLLSILKKVRFKAEKGVATKLAKKALTDANFSMRQAVENLESMYDRIKSGTSPDKILSGKVGAYNTEVDGGGEVEKIAGSLILAIVRDDAKTHEAIEYILPALSHIDPINVIERMIGILYYGYIMDKGGKWNWQSKPYRAILKKGLGASPTMHILDGLTSLLNVLRSTECDIVPLASVGIAKIAVKYRKV